MQGHPDNRLDIDIKLLQIIYLNPETKCLLRVHFVVKRLKSCTVLVAGGWSDQEQDEV